MSVVYANKESHVLILDVPYCISWEGDEEQQEQEPPSKLHTTPPLQLLSEDCSQWRNKVSQPSWCL